METTLKEFTFQEKMDSIEIKLEQNKLKILSNSFNVLSVSSLTSHRENFHSDIIAFILDPDSPHNDGNYAKFFIEYINGLTKSISSENYTNPLVTKEKGRIDIWIRDNTSKRCIIIENKINNAVDQDRQLERYYDYSKSAGYEVDCIIYLSLNGDKTAPHTENEELNKLVLNIAACKNHDNDLYNGWLINCYQNSKDENISSFIYQYGKLLNHLSTKGMDKELQQEFYDIVSEIGGQKRIETIVHLASRLLEYRAEVFGSAISNNHQPFKKRYRYKPNYWLFESYNDGENSFKLDVHFRDDSSVRIDFWNPGKNEDIQFETTREKLTLIGLENDFIQGGYGGGHFRIIEETNIKGTDKEVLEYVKYFFDKLCNS